MTVRELAKTVTWKQLEQSMLDFYSSESKLLFYYKKLYWFLCNSDTYPVQQKVILFFDKLNIQSLTSSYFEVDEDESLEFVKEEWFKLAHFYIEPSMFQHADASEVLAHLLFELTYGERSMLLALFQK